MVDHLAAPRERVSMKAGNNRPFLWVREQKKKKMAGPFPELQCHPVSAEETFLVS